MKLTPEQKQRIVEEAMKSDKGRTRLAMAMTEPIRRNLGYSSIGRRAFSEVKKVCEQCGATYQGWHPDNGCELGMIENIMEE